MKFEAERVGKLMTTAGSEKNPSGRSCGLFLVDSERMEPYPCCFVVCPALCQAPPVLVGMEALQMLGSPSSWRGEVGSHGEDWPCRLLRKK